MDPDLLTLVLMGVRLCFFDRQNYSSYSVFIPHLLLGVQKVLLNLSFDGKGGG